MDTLSVERTGETATPDHFRKLLVVSPHCDDAVFACGELILRHAPALVARRIRRLHDEGLAPRRVALVDGVSQRKRHAVACYRSRLRPLATPGRPGHADAFSTEGYWRLAR